MGTLVKKVREIFRCTVCGLMIAVGGDAHAQSAFDAKGCVVVDSIKKWEILDNNKTIVYDINGVGIAFIIFDPYGNVRLTDNASFRVFSPTICVGDRVQVRENHMTTVYSVEKVRQQ